MCYEMGTSMGIKDINIMVYIGSMRGKASTEYKAIMKFLISTKWGNAAYEIVTADQVNIKTCLGCCNCFNLGICPLEGKDDMLQLKYKLLNADIIIISSPVYLHHLSGATKTFLDRISNWAHTFQLIGKRVIVCSATSTTGNEYVISYLKKAMTSFGCFVAGELTMSLMKSEDEFTKNFEEISNSLCNSFKYPTACKATYFQQQLYYSLKKVYLQNSEVFEAIYWKKHNLFNYFSFDDLLRENLNKNLVDNYDLSL